MGKQFLIADTHFGHKKIMDFENRPFDCPDDMDEKIIANWNSVVSDEDEVFFLGDFAICNKDKIPELLSRLNGKKKMIMGNHDRKYSVEWWHEAGFDFVSPYPIIINEWFMLSHEPMYICNNMSYKNIFGHIHGNPQYKDYSDMHFIVCCEKIEYTPIEFGAMIDKMSKGV